ncbi:hypothetical protein IGI37_000584 [Enterococcus sp. AZ194]|uniref:NAD(P)H-binding protein n=1 Tax=Enterococcus sp. AZ194 TaxID=2774629 RepID=UPI003F205E12
MRVVIFGGSGFVGQAIIHALQNKWMDNPNTIDAIVSISRRGKPQGTNLSDKGVTWVSADVFQVDTWAQYVKREDIVIDAIGIFYQKVNQGITYKKMHYEVAINLATVCKQNGARQFVYLSAAHGIPVFKEYLYWKRQAEVSIQQMIENVLIFRPSLLYNRRHQYWLAKGIILVKKVPMFRFFFKKMQPKRVDEFASELVKRIDHSYMQTDS